ncbi:MAG: hypothetical protein IE931_07565 [Sphingobacteriales bacterium]|nr:hypothetical protein [Sphingobacteriales bacterium]
MRKLVYTLMLLMPLTALGQIITENDIKVDDFGSKKLKNAPKKVYFKEFSIGYQYLVEGSATGRDRNLKADVNMTAALVSELTEQDIQTITDNAYKKAEKKLTDAGFTIVSGEAAKDINEYQKGVTQMTGGETGANNTEIMIANMQVLFFQN